MGAVSSKGEPLQTLQCGGQAFTTVALFRSHWHLQTKIYLTHWYSLREKKKKKNQESVILPLQKESTDSAKLPASVGRIGLR